MVIVYALLPVDCSGRSAEKTDDCEAGIAHGGLFRGGEAMSWRRDALSRMRKMVSWRRGSVFGIRKALTGEHGAVFPLPETITRHGSGTFPKGK